MTGGAATASLDVIIDPSGAQSGTTVVKRSLEDIKATSRQMTSDITKNFKSLKNLFSTLLGGYALKQIAGSFISAAESAENYRTSIRAVSASILEADQTFDRIRKWAEANPIDTDEAVGAFVRLRTAAVDNAEDALKAVADLSTVMQRDMREVAGAVVTTEVETLRNLGIILDRTGKQATIQFGNVRKTVEKDIASIRKGIIEVIQEAVGGSMQEAADNFRGVLDTMSGMWRGFQQDVMGTNETGPFEELKKVLRDVRDEWEAFAKTDDYKKLVEGIQNGIVTAVKSADVAVKALGTAFQLAVEHGTELKAVIVGLAAYQGGMAIVSILGKFNDQLTLGMALIPGTTSLIAKMGTAFTLMQVQAATAGTTLGALKAIVVGVGTSIKALLASIGPVGWAALAVGAGTWLVLRDNMKQAAEQAEITKNAIEKVNNEFGKANAATITAQLEKVRSKLKELETQAKNTTDEMLRASTAVFMSRNGVLGGNVGGAAREIVNAGLGEVNRLIADYRAQEKQLVELEQAAIQREAGVKAATGAASSSTSTKSAAELLVEKIRDEMKYLGKDGTSFLSVLDQWQSKLKPLSEDWKKITDLKFDILGDSAQKAAQKADLVLEKIQKQKDEAKELAEMYARADSEYLSSLGWENEQGFLSNEQYFQKLKAQVDELGLATKNVFNWTDYEKSLYSALQSAGLEGFTTELEKVNKKYEDGKIKLDEYTASVESLVTKWGSLPLVSNAGAEAMKNATNQMKTGFYDLNELTTQWIKDFQDGIADAIVEGQNFGDTLTDIGKEIEKLALKSILFGNNGTGGLFGGAFSWLTGLFSAKGNVFGSAGRLTAFAKGGVPSLSDYANTVHASPRVFGFAHGLGVFGEAGPEAVMPLDRNSRGELGVKVVGGYGNYGGNATAAASAPVTFTSQVVVNVNNTGSGEMSNEQAQQIGKAIDNAVEVKVAETMYKFNRMGAFNKRAFAR